MFGWMSAVSSLFLCCSSFVVMCCSSLRLCVGLVDFCHQDMYLPHICAWMVVNSGRNHTLYNGNRP